MRGFLPFRSEAWDLNADDLLRPDDAFSHPQEIVCDPDLSINEKRAILASWASDACSAAAMPGLRRTPAGSTASFDAIMDALKELDGQARQGIERAPKYRRWVRQGDVF